MAKYSFKPVYQKRIWGGQNLKTSFGRELPSMEKFGESWELVDRPEVVSELCTPVGGAQTIHDLWNQNRKSIFGTLAPESPRFPILIKLLDCVETLSIQVHPPASKAAALKGEPKTEMWCFLESTPEAMIYAGLKKGVTRDQFEKAIGTPNLEPLLHKIKTKPGQAMFLPSGRVHAIGAGNVILEIQQNSDTTYRVDDWGRVDTDGKPRELHVKQSMESIQFDDFEPALAEPVDGTVVSCEYFTVKRNILAAHEAWKLASDPRTFRYFFVARGDVRIDGETLPAGSASLISADHPAFEVVAGGAGADLFIVSWGK